MTGKRVTMRRFTGDNSCSLVEEMMEGRGFSSCARVGDYVYIFGGGLDNITQKEIIKFNTLTNTTTLVSDPDDKTSDFTGGLGNVAISIGTDIYIFGGNPGVAGPIIKFNTLDNTTTLVSDSNGKTSDFTTRYYASAAAVGTDIYVFGGLFFNTSLNQIIKFNTLTNTAVDISNNLGPTAAFTARYRTSAAAVGTDIYIFGGTGSGDQIIKFDTLDNTAILVSDPDNKTLTFTTRESTSAAAVGTDIYIFGGWGENGQVDEIIKFDTLTDTATLVSGSSTSVFTGRTNTSAAAVGTDIYVFGGIGNDNHLDEILKFSPKTFENIYPKTTVMNSKTEKNANGEIDDELVGSVVVSNGDECGLIVKDSFKILDDNVVINYDTGDEFGCVDVNSGNVFTARFDTSAAAVGTDIYVFGGNINSNGSKQIIKFNTLTNTTTDVSGLLTEVFTERYQTSAAAVGTDIYIFGGVSNYKALNQIIKFDTLTGTTVDVSDSSGKTSAFTSRYSTSAAAVGTDIYIFGGSPYSTVGYQIIKFDTLTGTTVDVSDSSGKTSAFISRYSTSAAAVGTDIYIFGGSDGSGRLNQIIKFNTLTNTATLVSGPLTSVFTDRDRTSAAAVGTDIYIFGGYASGYSNDIIKFSTLTNTATDVSGLLTTAFTSRYSTSAAAVGTDIYIFGGSPYSTVGDQIIKTTLSKQKKVLNTTKDGVYLNKSRIITLDEIIDRF